MPTAVNGEATVNERDDKYQEWQQFFPLTWERCCQQFHTKKKIPRISTKLMMSGRSSGGNLVNRESSVNFAYSIITQT